MDAILTKTTESIYDLPVQLLVRIFLLSEKQTHNSKPYPHLRLSWVCRYWREIINGSPVFWTVIKFSPWKGQEFIRELRSRSGSAELSVFLPSYDLVSRHHMDEVLLTFCELLACDSYRIKYLSVAAEADGEMVNSLGNVLPALKAFRFLYRGISFEPLTIVQSIKHLQYLEISRPLSSSSLSLLQSSFHNLKGLKIAFPSFRITRRFYISYLSLCSNLESLTIYTEADPGHIVWDHIPSAIILPNLIFLSASHYAFIDQLHAPALKNLKVGETPQLDISPQNYLILDEYDLSSITNLSICGYDIFGDRATVMWIRGCAGSIPRHYPAVPLTQFEAEDVDLRGEILPFISSTEPTQFDVHNRYPKNIRKTPKNPFLSKLLSKLYNLQVLSIDPYPVLNRRSIEFFNIGNFESFSQFFKEIFGNLVSAKLRWLIVTDQEGHLDLLRMLFKLINTYSSLSSLNRLTYHTDNEVTKYRINRYEFGKELIEFLLRRRKAGYDPLQQFEVEGGEPLPDKYVAEAARLGTRVHQVTHLPRRL